MLHIVYCLTRISYNLSKVGSAFHRINLKLGNTFSLDYKTKLKEQTEHLVTVTFA